MDIFLKDILRGVLKGSSSAPINSNFILFIPFNLKSKRLPSPHHNPTHNPTMYHLKSLRNLINTRIDIAGNRSKGYRIDLECQEISRQTVIVTRACELSGFVVMQGLRVCNFNHVRCFAIICGCERRLRSEYQFRLTINWLALEVLVCSAESA